MSKSGVSEMTYYVKAFASKTGDLSFNPITYIVKKRTHSGHHSPDVHHVIPS